MILRFLKNILTRFYSQEFSQDQKEPEDSWIRETSETDSQQQQNSWTQDLIPIQNSPVAQDPPYDQNMQELPETEMSVDANYRKQDFFNQQDDNVEEKIDDYDQEPRVPEYGENRVPSNSFIGNEEFRENNEFGENSEFKEKSEEDISEYGDKEENMNANVQVPNGGRFIPPPSDNAAEFISSFDEDDRSEHTTRHWMGFMSIDVGQNNQTLIFDYFCKI